MINKNITRIFFTTGLLFGFTGAIIYLYFFFFPIKRSGEWQVEITGNISVDKKELQNMISYLLKTEKGGLSSQEIQQAVLINPRIKEAEVSIKENKIIEVNIKELEVSYLLHRGSFLSSYSGEKVLSEKIVKFDATISPDLPFFYLTPSAMKVKSSDSQNRIINMLRRDIISLWKSTKEKYKFIWQRIAEIQFDIVQDKVEITMYATNIRAKFLIQTAINTNLLERIWSVFYFLEQKDRQKDHAFWTTIKLNNDNAIIKKIATQVR